MTTKAPERQSIGAGLYGLADLRAFVVLNSGKQADGPLVLRWLGQALNPSGHKSKQTDYTFADLISLFVVRQLLKEGVRPRNIRAAEDYLRGRWGMERPFLRSASIQTDGRHVWVDGEVIPGQIESADERGQQALLEPIRTSLKRVHYDDGAATHWIPAKGVVVDPWVQFGEPVLQGSRLPTASVAAVANRRGLDAAVSDLDIGKSAAKLAIDFEKRLAQARNN